MKNDTVHILSPIGMGSLDALSSNHSSPNRYFSDNDSIKVGQGASGSIADRGSIHQLVPWPAAR